MASCFSAEILIGKVPEGLMDGLMAAIEQDACLDYETGDDPKPWTESSKRLYDHEARHGCFENVEAYCKDNDIDFDRWTEEGDGEAAVLVKWRKGMQKPACCYTETFCGPETVCAEYVAEARDLLKRGDTEEALSQLNLMLAAYDIQSITQDDVKAIVD